MSRVTHPVIDLLAARLRSGSAPGRRDDDARLAVALEGGSSRASYGGGMVAELEERGILRAVDAVYGSSAGALNGAWFVCERVAGNIHGWWEPEVMNGVIDVRRALRGGAIVDTDHLVDHVYEQVTPMGYAEILASDVEYHPLATDARTGESTDLAPLIRSRADLQAALRATTRMPVLGGPPVRLGGREFIDAGIAEPIPVFTAVAQGATHVLVLRTKTPTLDPHPMGRLERDGVARWMRRHAPGAADAWRRRDETKAAAERFVAEDPRVLQIAPPADAPRISRLGRSESVMREAVRIGRTAARQALADLDDLT